MRATGKGLFPPVFFSLFALLALGLFYSQSPQVISLFQASNDNQPPQQPSSWPMIVQNTSFNMGKTPFTYNTADFLIHNYPQNSHCSPSIKDCISDLELKIAGPGWKNPDNTLSVKSLQAPDTAPYSSYGYALWVVDIAKTPEGKIYPSELKLSLSAYATTVVKGLRYRRHITLSDLRFKSSNGQDFSLDSKSTLANSGGLQYLWHNPADKGFCAAGGWGNRSPLLPTVATLTVNPHEKKAYFNAGFFGPLIYSNEAKKLPQNPYHCYLIGKETGKATLDLKLVFSVNFGAESGFHAAGQSQLLTPVED